MGIWIIEHFLESFVCFKRRNVFVIKIVPASKARRRIVVNVDTQILSLQMGCTWHTNHALSRWLAGLKKKWQFKWTPHKLTFILWWWLYPSRIMGHGSHNISPPTIMIALQFRYGPVERSKLYFCHSTYSDSYVLYRKSGLVSGQTKKTFGILLHFSFYPIRKTSYWLSRGEILGTVVPFGLIW